MTFFDEQNPNKYQRLKDLLVPHNVEMKNWTGRLSSQFDGKYWSYTYKFCRCGVGDGSYVLPAQMVEFSPLQILSYGIGDDPEGVSFEQSLDKDYNWISMYDGSIDEVPAKIQYGKFYKEYLTADNFHKHLKENTFGGGSDFNVLKMDIEGHEYDWLNDDNLALLKSYFAVICIEVHSLIEEVPDGWVLEPQLAQAKRDFAGRLRFFEGLNKHFWLWHMHANNHAPRHVDFPDSLELTYISKKWGKDLGVRREKFPVDGLDEPNYDGRPDYVLDWWI
jgi:hypothetical protein